MVFGVLSNLTDGFVIIYAVLLLICLVFNNKVMRYGYWYLSSGFALLQLVITIWIAGEGDDTSMVLMAFIFIVSLFKANFDRQQEYGK